MGAELHIDDLAAYKSYVGGIAAAADGKVIMNRHHGHASIIIAHIFGSSSDRVSILTGSLDPEVYAKPDVIQQAVEFLRRSPTASVRILAEQTVPPDHPLLSALSAEGRADRVQIALIPPALEREYHFAVGDARHYRFEAVKKVPEAIVRFGDAETGVRLELVFDSLFKSVTEAAGATPERERAFA